jgi:lipopolysaccharide/colanic/teichoic acid biosynthesis glycosyltransferase
MIYPQVSEGILDVDQIAWQRQQVLALPRLRPHSAIIAAWGKKYLLDPVLFLLISCVLLLAPQRLVRVLSQGHALSLLRRMVIRSIDIMGAGVGLFLALPFFIFVPLLIRLDSPGPVFYKQVRTGRDRRRRERRVAGLGAGLERRHSDRRQRNLFGKPFFIYKFRTMTNEAERRSGAVWASADDPRITNVGRWLRKYHIDEIPQFWNILRGEMSMVGPRPERPEIINKLTAVVPEYRQRLHVKPGLTGLAQICLGYDSCLEDVKRKIHLDLLYISNPSIHLYLRILLHTFNKIVSSTTIERARIVPSELFEEELPVTDRELLHEA